VADFECAEVAGHAEGEVACAEVAGHAEGDEEAQGEVGEMDGLGRRQRAGA
jgi:hypothetical protein